jgi:ubiquinone/menaquinone biosynthesis C-methylase UbiE
MRNTAEMACVAPQERWRDARSVPVPDYLTATYSWAYVHPNAVRVFERPWLVNAILWGYYARLRDAALDALAPQEAGRTLQIGCVYGDLTTALAARIRTHNALDVIDVLTIQLDNVDRKLGRGHGVRLIRADSAALPAPTAHYQRALLFFLLHEQPAPVRRATITEALRVVAPGGSIVIVDYHRPPRYHPLHWPMRGILSALEPFALDLWSHELWTWMPGQGRALRHTKSTFAGGLYQVLRITC